MAFRVELSELAAGRLRKLDANLRNRIVRKLEQTATDPSRFLERLSVIESYKLRVGDYRLIIDVDGKGNTLYVLTLGHRSVVYR